MYRQTRDDVAKLAGVSTATVSRVINQNGAPVSEELRNRVLAVADQLGYRPNLAARALVTGKTRLVAMWASDCYTPYYSMLGKQMALRWEQRHYQVIASSRRHFSNASDLIVPTTAWQVDGLLLLDTASLDPSVLSLYKPGIPRVSVGVFHEDTRDLVEVDLYIGARQALTHLMSPGCRRIAYMHNEESSTFRDPRSRAYRDLLREAGLEGIHITIPNQERQTARTAIKDHVREHGLPEAIFCVNDDVALGCYRGLLDLGVRIPDDVALVGCDGLPELEYLETPISTLVSPVEALCEYGWKFLERRIEEPDTPVQQITLPTQLVIRESSRR